jgi:hypothetical protein
MTFSGADSYNFDELDTVLAAIKQVYLETDLDISSTFNSDV